jgi:hypothetical protein
MQTEAPTQGADAEQTAPEVFENLMSVEKVGAVEETIPLKSPWLGGMVITG